MRIIRKSYLIETAAQEWEKQYSFFAKDLNTFIWDGRTAKEVYNRLLRAKTAEEINEIIGNSAWTDLFCSECCESVDVAVEFNNETLCSKCMKDALEIIGKVEE